MSDCHKCWWADYNADSPTLHTIVEEQDFFNMKGPFSEIPMVRIVKSCGKGQAFFKITPRNNNCPKFERVEDYQAALDETIADRRKNWSTPTSRFRMEAGANGFAAIATMQEDHDPTYQWLVDLLFADQVAFSEIVTGLDDMNIRGRQIEMVVDTFEGSIPAILKAVRDRDYKLVKWLNQEYDKSNVEEAVCSGASLFGHKDNPDAKDRKPPSTRPARSIRPRPLASRGRKIETRWGRGSGDGADDDT